jgi:hypothetical protein
MYIGFVIRHVAKKLLIGGAAVACAALATDAGRRIAKISMAAIKGAGKAAFDEAKSHTGACDSEFAPRQQSSRCQGALTAHTGIASSDAFHDPFRMRI